MIVNNIKLTLSESEIQFLLLGLKEVNSVYSKGSSRDFAWEQDHEKLFQKLSEAKKQCQQKDS